MMTEPVSAIIPCYNSADTIERAINSAAWAGCDRILVYDDGSTDCTLDHLEKLGKLYPTLEVYADLSLYMHRGVNYARNLLCEKAKGGLIIPLDSDDELINISHLREAWQPETWVYGDYQMINSHQSLFIKGCPAGMLSRKELTGITFLFHFDDWKRVGGYDSDFAYIEDYGLQCALTHAGIKPTYIDKLVYNRYIKASGNERSVLAREYWPFYRDIARRKYPNLFAVNR